ncbi:hypothetical protein [Staphylococcus hominis]|uniref:hypothetical protein n=1 Tax=Staphylococcus hominis TaxID=1290 RepID=UPI000C7A5A6A|nr:hypothetical protein [Staphylococcus hominis]MCI2895971.1 hypothetical protein [Staphylococcus hominis]MCI2904481.1 hypothetical protein [Staphylococcus hominis]MCI2906611.1 hypothetical protein [Staphylococcus hominis]MCI2913005.1 hypothetical protein [Staphylococcus hominis]MCT1471181.1 hypothetical protein [Staphylococcus hominis]
MFIAFSLLILTISVGLGKLPTFPKSVIIIGTIAILLMNIFEPIIEGIEWIYSKLNSRKEINIKGNSFIISFVASIIIAIFSYNIFQNIKWFEKIMENGFVWGINTSILLFNIAILEIQNNKLKAEEEYNRRQDELLEKYKDKETIKRLKTKEKLRHSEGEENERKSKDQY